MCVCLVFEKKGKEKERKSTFCSLWTLFGSREKKKEEATFSIKGFILNVEHQKKKKKKKLLICELSFLWMLQINWKIYGLGVGVLVRWS